VLVLTQPEVPQYAQVVQSVLRTLPGAAVVDVGDGKALDPALVREMDVAVAVGSKAFELAKARLPQTPIVAAAVLAPDAGGRADVTAVPLEPRGEDALSALSTVAPGARRVVVIHPPNAAAALQDARAAAKASGLAVQFRPLPELSNFQTLFRSVMPGNDAIWLLPDARMARPEIVHFMVSSCLEQRVALVGFLEGMTRSGALLSVSADFEAIGKAAAQLAAQIGEKKPRAARLPFVFAPGKVSVNARTRELLGLTSEVPEHYGVIR
jgi:ABC-type uncharacterized transport system substrate-binding protein